MTPNRATIAVTCGSVIFQCLFLLTTSQGAALVSTVHDFSRLRADDVAQTRRRSGWR